MHLYRAFAYQIQALETFSADVEPEVMVFWEAHHPGAAIATLQRLLALSWGCRPDDIEYHNLDGEPELHASWGDIAPGDAALWVSGAAHGPLFQPADRTLMFVRPSTLRRLLQARQATLPLLALQRAAARDADARAQRQQRQRHAFMADLSAALARQPASTDRWAS